MNRALISPFHRRKKTPTPWPSTWDCTTKREYCRSCSEITDSTVSNVGRRVDYLNWNGISMFEYRWDPSTDKFFLMELNARFWGSLHLPIHAGVDFPKLLVSAWSNETFPLPDVRTGICCRLTFPKEVEYVISRMKSPNLGFLEKSRTLIEFFQLSLDSRIKSDMLFPGDNQLYWRSISATVKKLLS